MSGIKRLEQSLTILRNSVCGFPIGAVTPDDFKPIEEKIQDLRFALKCLSSRLQMLYIKMNFNTSPPYTSKNNVECIDQLIVKISNCLINNNASKFCIYSQALQNLFFTNNIDDEARSQMKIIMKKLFMMNDKMLAWQTSIIELFKKEIQLKDECSQYISEFHNFLKDQENIRNKTLEKSNPEVVAKKERVKKLIYKINLMKRLITNFISAGSSYIKVFPELEVMLKKHRDLVSIDTIMETAENRNNDRED